MSTCFFDPTTGKTPFLGGCFYPPGQNEPIRQAQGPDRFLIHSHSVSVSHSENGELGKWGNGEMGEWGNGRM
jgi:hypothetical protein